MGLDLSVEFLAIWPYNYFPKTSHLESASAGPAGILHSPLNLNTAFGLCIVLGQELEDPPPACFPFS